MKTSLIKFAAASLLAITLGSVAQGVTITAIMRTGIPNDGWTTNSTVTSTTQSQVQLGLRARTRFGSTLPVTDTGAGEVYTTENGYYSVTSSLWNIDFSINSDASLGTDKLTAYKY